MVSNGAVDRSIVSANAISDYSYVNGRSDYNVQLTRCVTGLGPNGSDPNSAVGGVYFNPFTAVTAIWRFEVITHAAICVTLTDKYF